MISSILQEDNFPKAEPEPEPKNWQRQEESNSSAFTTFVPVFNGDWAFPSLSDSTSSLHISEDERSVTTETVAELLQRSTSPPHTPSTLFICKNITLELTSKIPPMACWTVDLHQLLWFNESFAQLLEHPVELLQNGFRIPSVQIIDINDRIVRLQDVGNNALKDLYNFHRLVRSGKAQYLHIYFSLLSGKGNIKSVQVSLIAYDTSIQWVCTEITILKAVYQLRDQVAPYVEWQQTPLQKKKKSHLWEENSFHFKIQQQKRQKLSARWFVG